MVQTQVWPLLRYLEASAPSTAASTSASSKTMKGAFPPSSIDAFLIVGAHWPSSSRPTSVDPVKLSFLTSGLPVSSPPIARDPPVITLNSPAGSPASSASAARSEEHTGGPPAGFQTPAHPAPDR